MIFKEFNQNKALLNTQKIVSFHCLQRKKPETKWLNNLHHVAQSGAWAGEGFVSHFLFPNLYVFFQAPFPERKVKHRLKMDH